MGIIKDISLLIKKIKNNPSIYNNEKELYSLHVEFEIRLEKLNRYLYELKKKNFDVNENKKKKLINFYKILNDFYIKYYNLLYRNSVYESNSKFFKEPVNAFHFLALEKINKLKIISDEQNVEYKNKVRKEVEIDICLKFELAKNLQKILSKENNSSDEEEENNIELIIEEPKKKKKENILYETGEYIFEGDKFKWVNSKDSDDEDVEEDKFINNSVSSEMKNYFVNKRNEINILEYKLSDDLELFMPYNSDKISMHIFPCLLRLHYYYEVIEINNTKIKQIFVYCYTFGLSSLFYGRKKIFNEYTLKDIYTCILTLFEKMHLFFKIINIIEKCHLLDKILIKNNLYLEIIKYIHILYKRFYEIFYSNNKNNIDVEMFQFFTKEVFGVNSLCIYYFSHAYKTLFEIFDNEKYRILHKEYYDYSNKKFEKDDFIPKFEKFIGQYKGIRDISNKLRKNIYKFTSIPFNRDWFIYLRYNEDYSKEQKIIVEYIRDHSKLQRNVIETLEIEYDKWLFQIWKKILIDITIISKESYQDKLYHDQIKDSLEKLEKKSIKKIKLQDEFKVDFKQEFRQFLMMDGVDLNFITSKGYRFWKKRFIIPYACKERYGYLFEEELLLKSSNIYEEPLIINDTPFTFSVYFRGLYIYCGEFYNAFYVWCCYMYKYYDMKIRPLKNHSIIKDIESYYIWVYFWKKIYCQKEFELSEFFDSLTNDSINIGEIFNIPEKKEKKKQIIEEKVDENIQVIKNLSKEEEEEVDKIIFGDNKN